MIVHGAGPKMCWSHEFALFIKLHSFKLKVSRVGKNMSAVSTVQCSGFFSVVQLKKKTICNAVLLLSCGELEYDKRPPWGGRLGKAKNVVAATSASVKYVDRI